MAKLFLTKCALIAGGLATALIVIVLLRTALYFPVPQELINCEHIDEHKPITDGERQVVDRFIQALRLQTITKAPHDYDDKQIQLFIEFLNRSIVSFNTIFFMKSFLYTSVKLIEYFLWHTVFRNNRLSFSSFIQISDTSDNQ